MQSSPASTTPRRRSATIPVYRRNLTSAAHQRGKLMRGRSARSRYQNAVRKAATAASQTSPLFHLNSATEYDLRHIWTTQRGVYDHEAAAPSASIPKTFPSDQCLDPNLVALRCLVLLESGADDGNRTHGERASEPLKQAVWRECWRQV
jgi:hypothetical protein